jgi:hypothetical protein
MSYVYLLELHQLVDQRLAEADQSVDDITNNPGEIRFHQGRIAMLSDFKDFLTENLNPKLPRRIRKRYLEGLKTD